MEKAEIKYPCQWTYRIIGTDETELVKIVSDCMGDVKYDLSLANRSSMGKYISLNLETMVENEESRDKIFNCLKAKPAVKMII